MTSELRRVIEIGGSYYVSIPKGWAERLRISKGSLLEILPTEDGHLLIRPHTRSMPSMPKKVRIKATDGLKRRIVMAYLAGFDEIEVYHPKGLSLDHRKIIESTAELLIGLEIVREDLSSVTLECLWLKPGDPWVFIRRMDLIAQSMYKDAISSLAANDIERARAVIERDTKVDKLYFLVVRMIRSMLSNPCLSMERKITPVKLLDYRLLARDVEEIADRAEEIARAVLNIISKVGSSSLNGRFLSTLAIQMSKLETRILNAYEERSFDKVLDLARELESIRSRLEEYTSRLTGARPSLLEISVLNNIARILDLQADMIDLIA